jgi:hypothetical protein
MADALIFGSGAAGIVIAACAFFGWGRLVRRCAGLPQGTWPLSVALGLAVAIFFGSLLNLARLAYPWALDAILTAGLALAIYEWHAAGLRPSLAAWWPARKSERLYTLAWYAIVLAVMGFAIQTELSPRLYNLSDDFQKYFAHTVRMVETGTLTGSPLNALGSETLGAQAFLQSFIVGHFPIAFINGADRIFCFALCLMLAGSIARGRPALGPAAILGVLAVVFINPQLVNISSLYSSAALFMSLLVLSADPREVGPSAITPWRRAIAPGLLAAAIIALKPTGLLFLAVQFVLATAGAIWAAGSWRGPLRSSLAILLGSAGFTVPWLLLWAPDYIAGLTHPLPNPATRLPVVIETADLLATSRLFYGASMLAYTLIALALGIFALLCGLARKERRSATPRLYALNLAATCAAAAISYIAINTLGLGFVESLGALRYSIPILIGIMPAALSLAALHLDDATKHRGAWLAGVFGIALVGMFANSALERGALLLQHGTELAFLPSADKRAVDFLHTYEDAVLHGPIAEEVGYFQTKIPAGEPILAWIGAPFLLDFKRNPIIDVNESGLGMSWSQIPPAPFSLWQSQGYGIMSPQDYQRNIRTIGRRMGFVFARTLDFRQRLEQLVQQSDILANEDGMIVLQLKSVADHP